MNSASNEMKKKKTGRYISVVVLVGLMLVGSYLGTLSPLQSVSGTLPIARVPLQMPEKEEADAPNDIPKGPEPAPSKAPLVAQAETGFAGYKEAIAKVRSTASVLLDEVIDSSSANADTVQQALKQKVELADAIKMETEIESLLHARGFFDVLCTVNQQSVNVVVQCDVLSQQQAAQILDIAMSVSGQPASNIRIIPTL